MAASITGNVINQRTIQPIGGASLQLSGSASQNTTSGTDGKFAFNNLAEGNYDLLVTKDGFENGNYGPLVVFDGITLNLHLALQYEMT